MSIPADLKYTESHEWVRTEADGTLDHRHHRSRAGSARRHRVRRTAGSGQDRSRQAMRSR